MDTVCLDDFVAFLSGLNADHFKSVVLDDYLSSHQIEREGLLPFEHFRTDTYGRNLITKNDFYELLLLTWLPQQRTPIHDHADQRCWMLLQSGTLCYKNYKPPVSDNLVASGAAEIHREGERVYIDDGIGVHSIVNHSGVPATSLHIYAGPIPRCRIYRESTRKFEWIELEYYTSALITG